MGQPRVTNMGQPRVTNMGQPIDEQTITNL